LRKVGHVLHIRLGMENSDRLEIYQGVGFHYSHLLHFPHLCLVSSPYAVACKDAPLTIYESEWDLIHSYMGW